MSIGGKDLSIYEFSKICRTCLGEGEMKSLYENCSSEVCVVEMLMTCTFVQFAENDGLPSQICMECFKSIHQAFSFAKKCEESDKIVRRCIREFQNKLKKPEENENRTKKLRETRTKKQQVSEASDEHAPSIEYSQRNNNEEANEYIVVKSEAIHSDQESCSSFDNSEQSNKVQNEVSASDVFSEKRNDNDEMSDTERIHVKKRNAYKLKTQPPYECKRCLETFATFQLLKMHRKEFKHASNHYERKVCPICSKSIGYSRMNQHLRVHTLERPYCCEVCGARFSISSNLRRHMLSRHSSEKPYKCTQCEKGFTRLALLKDHQRIHSGEKPFVCNFCGKAFAQSAAFRTHLFIHAKKGETTGQITGKEHECKNCQRCFATKTLLKAHQLIHGEKKFLCSDCGRGFHSMILLKSHSKVHTGIKPYNCTLCDKSFSHIGSLKSHTLIHTGVKPFVCTVCNRAFTQRNHLKYHQRTHSGERPYTCTVCGKSFALNGNLTVHMRTHTGETPYYCPDCNKGFHDSSSMKKHRKGHVNTTTLTPI